MAGRHGVRYDERPERQNEYFVPGEGISREVIQADICRYLGNDALVRPGVHQGAHGYLIRAYRNLTSEMIADLKADSARWEADVSRREQQGYPRGSYVQDPSMTGSPNTVPATYSSSQIHEVRQQMGPSPSYPAGGQQYMEYTAPPTYGSSQPASGYPPNVYGSQPGNFGPSRSPYGSGQGPYVSSQNQPPVSAPDNYTYTSYAGAPAYSYNDGRSTAPRYPGQGYENEPEYSSPVTSGMSGMSYPATTAPDPRISMDPRYTPDSAYSDHRTQASSRPQQTRDSRGEPHRRTR